MELMKKECIPYKEALALKELGYNKSSNLRGNEKSVMHHYSPETNKTLEEMNGTMSGGEGYITAILYQQAFEWLREEYDLQFKTDKFRNFSFTILDCGVIPTIFGDTYREAEQSCLESLIKIAKDKC